MRFLRILAAGILLSFFALSGAQAQQANVYWCTSATIPCPPSGWAPASTATPFPVTASVSIAGFHPVSSLTPITATTGGVTSSAFTAGQSILVQNVGATNAAYCAPGASATTSSQYIAPGSSAVITTTTETTITCATSTSTTTVNFQVGTGLWTGAGGGGGGSGSSGAVYGPTAVGSANANPPVVIGGTATGAAGQNVQGLAIKPASTAPLATDQSVVVSLSPNSPFTNWAGGTLGAMANYGTSPGAVLVPGVNAFITNTNANGAATAANSSPVTPSNQPIGAAAFAATQVSVTSSATSILAARTGVAGTGRVSATICNTTTTAIYIGGSGVTASTGSLLAGVIGACLTVNTTAALYGISGGSSATVTALETF